MDTMTMMARELAQDPHSLSVRLLARAFNALEVAEQKARDVRPARQAEVWAMIAYSAATVGDLAATIESLKPLKSEVPCRDRGCVGGDHTRSGGCLLYDPQSDAKPLTDVDRTPDAHDVVVSMMRRLRVSEALLSEDDINEARGFTVELIARGNGDFYAYLHDKTD